MAKENREQQLHRLNREVKYETGTEYFLYLSRPGDGQNRYVFQDGVKFSLPSALEHMREKHHEVFPDGAPERPQIKGGTLEVSNGGSRMVLDLEEEHGLLFEWHGREGGKGGEYIDVRTPEAEYGHAVINTSVSGAKTDADRWLDFTEDHLRAEVHEWLEENK